MVFYLPLSIKIDLAVRLTVSRPWLNMMFEINSPEAEHFYPICRRMFMADTADLQISSGEGVALGYTHQKSRIKKKNVQIGTLTLGWASSQSSKDKLGFTIPIKIINHLSIIFDPIPSSH